MLKLENVNAYYGLHHILEGISFALEAGEILALLGRNGAGKTTTLRTIMGLVDHRTGTIEFEGTSLVGRRPHEINRLGIAYVPEYRGIFSDLTTRENLSISAFRAGVWSVDDVLELFPALKELLDRKGRHLSGGEQQMLAIGRMLLSSPRYMLLDEPSQGLAPVVVETVVDTLQHLRKQNLGLLLVEQNVGVALDVADRVCIVEQGSIVFQGTAREAREQPAVISQYLGVG